MQMSTPKSEGAQNLLTGPFNDDNIYNRKQKLRVIGYYSNYRKQTEHTWSTFSVQDGCFCIYFIPTLLMN